MNYIPRENFALNFQCRIVLCPSHHEGDIKGQVSRCVCSINKQRKWQWMYVYLIKTATNHLEETTIYIHFYAPLALIRSRIQFLYEDFSELGPDPPPLNSLSASIQYTLFFIRTYFIILMLKLAKFWECFKNNAAAESLLRIYFFRV